MSSPSFLIGSTCLLFALSAQAKVASGFRIVDTIRRNGDQLSFTLLWNHPGGASSIAGNPTLYCQKRKLSPGDAGRGTVFKVGLIRLTETTQKTPIQLSCSALQQALSIKPGDTFYVAALFAKGHMWGTNGNGEGLFPLTLPDL